MTTEPTRLQRAWDAWLDATSDDQATNDQLAEALAEATHQELLADIESARGRKQGAS